jgi:hypothetical protein
MKLSKSVAELQREHVVLELECIDRMYLNAYVPQLATEGASQPLCAVSGTSLCLDQSSRADDRELCGVDHAVWARSQNRSGPV